MIATVAMAIMHAARPMAVSATIHRAALLRLSSTRPSKVPSAPGTSLQRQIFTITASVVRCISHATGLLMEAAQLASCGWVQLEAGGPGANALTQRQHSRPNSEVHYKTHSDPDKCNVQRSGKCGRAARCGAEGRSQAIALARSEEPRWCLSNFLFQKSTVLEPISWGFREQHGRARQR
jgi:hypothetical protein